MSNVKKLLKGLGGLAILVIGLTLIVSCSEKGILQSDNNQIDNDLAAINSVDAAKDLFADNPGMAKTEGGIYLVAKTEYGFEARSDRASYGSFNLGGTPINVKVPAYAFDKNKWGDRLYIYVRAEKWMTPSGLVYFYECNPGGVVFKQPITLTQPYKNASVGSENLYYSSNSYWVVEDVQYLRNGTAVFNIHHFSKYAIAD